ncbi:MAG: hypothetical protein R3E79_48895 [Caldilineaceae bacterium]
MASPVYGVDFCGRTPARAIADVRHIRTPTGLPFGVNWVLHGLHPIDACLAERPPIFAFFVANRRRRWRMPRQLVH